LFEKEAEMLDLAVIQNRYKNNPPHPIIEEGSSIIGSDPVGEDEIIKGYLAAGEFKKAGEAANNIQDAKAKVVPVAIIEFTLGKKRFSRHFAANAVELLGRRRAQMFRQLREPVR